MSLENSAQTFANSSIPLAAVADGEELFHHHGWRSNTHNVSTTTMPWAVKRTHGADNVSEAITCCVQCCTRLKRSAPESGGQSGSSAETIDGE